MQEFEERIISWAREQPDVEALIQFGSRVSEAGSANTQADWDFHLITTRVSKYQGTRWLETIAPVWCASAEKSSRGQFKISAFFVDGYEVDFIPLAAWQIKLVFAGMNYPRKAALMPKRLKNGILELREIYQNSGARLLLGGKSWEKRLATLRIPWAEPQMQEEEFCRHVSEFWQRSVWVAKKIARPEPRSAMLWLNRLVLEHVFALLEEEAWLEGRRARPEALKAEQWLTPKRLAQTDVVMSLDQKLLARALFSQIELFEEISPKVASARGFFLRDYSEVARWVRRELEIILTRP